MPGRALHASNRQSNLNDALSSVPKIFDQVQVSVANHQKNCVALHKIHAEAAEFIELIDSRTMNRLTGEKMFAEVVQCLLFRVLVLKKGVATADRVVKFIGAYIKFINEKAGDEPRQQDDDDDSVASRFTARLLRFLLKGIAAKDKNVRYRVLQTLVEMISHLGEIDEDLYGALREGLLDRVRDKEAHIRSQAIVALCKLCAEETADDIDNDQEVVSSVLPDALAHDPSFDVRRAVLLNLPVDEATIPHILARMRDVEPLIRKLVFSAVLEPNATQGNEFKVTGPTHPRAFTISQREQIIKDGLGDREESVRNAATSLIGSWIDSVNVAAPKTEDSEGEPVTAEVEGVLSLLKLFDLGQSTVAVDALLSVFTRRLDIFNKIDLNESYWERLNPERAFLARVFADHCIAIRDHKRLEEALPTVSQIAAVIERAWNGLTVLLEAFEEERLIREFEETESQQREDEIYEQEIKLGEMLKMAVNLDYGDENGRRLMFPLIREMASRETLPQGLFDDCLDILKKLAANDRDLIRIVVEIISDMRDPFIDEPEEPIDVNLDTSMTLGDTPRPRLPPREKTEAEKKKAIEVDHRCLLLASVMLERVNTTFEENSTLEGLMRDLIVPSIHVKDAQTREEAFVALGLCCSIARKRALNSVDFFRSQILSSPDQMKSKLYQIIIDMLMVHDQAFVDTVPQKVAEITDRFLVERLNEEQDPKVLATLCLGIAKLIVAGIARDINSVANLMLAALSPATAGNQELRQCLTGFFPVYSYMSAKNQKNMTHIFLQVFSEVKKSRAGLEEDEEVATAAQVANMFVDLTDPNRLASVVTANGTMNEKEIYEYGDIHLRLAAEILREFLKPQYDFDRDDKKVLCQMLAKLYIPEVADDMLIRRLKLYLDTVKARRSLKDVTSRNALNKFDAAISKRFENQLELKEEELRRLEELQDLFEFLDDIIPEDDDELVDPEPRRRDRKRRSTSAVNTDDDSHSHDGGHHKPKAKKRRISSEGDDWKKMDSRPAAKTRVMPKRAATGKIHIQPITITDSEDENQVSPPKNEIHAGERSRRIKKEDEMALDTDINRLLEPLPSASATSSSSSSRKGDSIIGHSEEEEEDEEDEVNDLLAEEDS